jgi:hypothetical protein
MLLLNIECLPFQMNWVIIIIVVIVTKWLERGFKAGIYGLRTSGFSLN